MESAPHNTVHDWVGSESNPGRENMGSYYSAARDASFYSHHSNIDRLWEVWRDIHGNKLDVLDSDWLETFFFFYDEKWRLVRIRVKDVVETKKLGYAYEEIPLPWLNSRPKPSFDPKLARQILNKRNASNDLNHPHRRSLTSSITVRIKRPQINRNQREKNNEEEVISVLGIVVNKDAYTKFDVYVNLIEETVASPRMREFAGKFVHIPKRGRSSDTTDIKFGISELLTELEADADESIWVTMLPRSKSCVNLTFDAIRVEYVT